MGQLSRMADDAVARTGGDPAELRRIADKLMEEAASRGLLVQLAVASLAGELRRRAALSQQGGLG